MKRIRGSSLLFTHLIFMTNIRLWPQAAFSLSVCDQGSNSNQAEDKAGPVFGYWRPRVQLESS